jgi:hypothetical protein
MFRRIRKHANPASLIAMVALFVALGGVSYAAATINGKDIKNKSIAGKKLKNGAVNKAKVKKGSLTADRLTAGARASLKGNQGNPGPAGPQGPQGVAGTALAYAQVSSTGASSLVSARTSGFVAVTRPATGRYCLQPTPEVIAQAFAPNGSPTRPTVASVEYGNTSNQEDQLTVAPRGANNLCPDNTFEVHTYRTGAESDTVSFTLLVP